MKAPDPELDALLKHRAHEIQDRRTRAMATGAVVLSLVALGVAAGALLVAIFK